MVYVHTNTLPDWVPIAGEGRVIQTWSDEMKQVLAAGAELKQWRTAEIADHLDVELSQRQVLDHLNDGEYADEEVHVNTCESHASLMRRWLSPHRGISKDKLTQYLRAFQLRRELYRKPGRDALKHAVRATL